MKVKTSSSAILIINGDVIGHTSLGLEPKPARRFNSVIIVGNNDQITNVRACIDCQQSIEIAAISINLDSTVNWWLPEIPDRGTARTTGMIRLSRFLGGAIGRRETVKTCTRGKITEIDAFSVCEVVICYLVPKKIDKVCCTDIYSVNGNVVGGSGSSPKGSRREALITTTDKARYCGQFVRLVPLYTSRNRFGKPKPKIGRSKPN